MQEKQTIFADGFIARRRDDAQNFLITKLSLKVSEALEFIKKHEKDGWLNLEVKRGRSGGLYVALDTYDPQKKGDQPVEQPVEDTDDMPF